MRRRRTFRTLIATLAALTGAVGSTGVYVTATGAAAPPDTIRAAGEHPGSIGSVTQRHEEPVTTGTLRRLVLSTLLVVAQRPISDEQQRRIARMDGVQETTAFDAGGVRVSGRRVVVFGVEHSTFRSWTPPPTASSDGLWTRIAQGEMAVSFAAGRQLDVRLGRTYDLNHGRPGRLRVGATAAFGLPGADAVVSERVGRSLGLEPDRGMLINAPGADLAGLERSLRALLGEGAHVERLRQAVATVPAGGASSPREYGMPDRPGPAVQAGPTPEARAGKPRTYKQLYIQAAQRCPGLSWSVLAAIGQIESGHGRNMGPSSAGALGPMQFLPSTWWTYGVDGDGDGEADIMNPYDAVPSAARYLCANGAGGAPGGLRGAVFAYNHAWWYVQEVLSLAERYAAT